MPIYEYKCGPCGEVIELKMSFEKRDFPITCETCGNLMARQFTIPAVQFKGSGFYSTDNRK